MTASLKERVILGVIDLIGTALGTEVQRNLAKPEAVGPSGLVILRDGEPGEPEVTMSPPSYGYQHRIEVEIGVYPDDGTTGEARLDEMLGRIGRAIEADRFLGGLVEWLEPQASDADQAEGEGSDVIAIAVFNILACYSTSNPLT